MEKSINKFLEFNGQAIYFLAKDGVYWIAIKPICDAIGIDYDAQVKSMKADRILSEHMGTHAIQTGKEKLKNWVCLPEFFIYGWIFSLKGSSKGLHDYQWQCYELLYNHFHGTVGNRKDLLREEARLTVEREKVMKDLERNPEWIQLMEIEKIMKKNRSELKYLDKELFTEQLTLFSTST